MKTSFNSHISFVFLIGVTTPLLTLADISEGLRSSQGFLLNNIFPVIAVIGIVYACLQLVFGNADGLRKAAFAGLGVGIAFASQALISMLRGFFN